MERKDAGEANDEVKIYSTDSGHQLGTAEPGLDTTAPWPPEKGRRAALAARCRAEVNKHPGTTLAVAALAGGLLGALLGFGAARRR